MIRFIPYQRELQTKMYNTSTCRKQTTASIPADKASGASGIFKPEGMIDSLIDILNAHIKYNAIVAMTTRQV